MLSIKKYVSVRFGGGGEMGSDILSFKFSGKFCIRSKWVLQLVWLN